MADQVVYDDNGNPVQTVLHNDNGNPVQTVYDDDGNPVKAAAKGTYRPVPGLDRAAMNGPTAGALDWPYWRGVGRSLSQSLGETFTPKYRQGDPLLENHVVDPRIERIANTPLARTGSDRVDAFLSPAGLANVGLMAAPLAKPAIGTLRTGVGNSAVSAGTAIESAGTALRNPISEAMLGGAGGYVGNEVGFPKAGATIGAGLPKATQLTGRLITRIGRAITPAEAPPGAAEAPPGPAGPARSLSATPGGGFAAGAPASTTDATVPPPTPAGTDPWTMAQPPRTMPERTGTGSVVTPPTGPGTEPWRGQGPPPPPPPPAPERTGTGSNVPPPTGAGTEPWRGQGPPPPPAPERTGTGSNVPPPTGPGSAPWTAQGPVPPPAPERTGTGSTVTPPTGPGTIPWTVPAPDPPPPPLGQTGTGNAVTPPAGTEPPSWNAWMGKLRTQPVNPEAAAAPAAAVNPHGDIPSDVMDMVRQIAAENYELPKVGRTYNQPGRGQGGSLQIVGGAPGAASFHDVIEEGGYGSRADIVDAANDVIDGTGRSNGKTRAVIEAAKARLEGRATGTDLPPNAHETYETPREREARGDAPPRGSRQPVEEAPPFHQALIDQIRQWATENGVTLDEEAMQKELSDRDTAIGDLAHKYAAGAEDASFDVNEFGEPQGRLPGAEGARQVGQADTHVARAPQQASGDDFGLDSRSAAQQAIDEAIEAKKAEGPGLFEEPVSAEPGAGKGPIKPEDRGARTQRRAQIGSAAQAAEEGTTRANVINEVPAVESGDTGRIAKVMPEHVHKRISAKLQAMIDAGATDQEIRDHIDFRADGTRTDPKTRAFMTMLAREKGRSVYGLAGAAAAGGATAAGRRKALTQHLNQLNDDGKRDIGERD